MSDVRPILSLLVTHDDKGQINIEFHRHALDHYKVIAAGGALAAFGWQVGNQAALAPVEPIRTASAVELPK